LLYREPISGKRQAPNECQCHKCPVCHTPYYEGAGKRLTGRVHVASLQADGAKSGKAAGHDHYREIEAALYE
jgi:hypothetical protein